MDFLVLWPLKWSDKVSLTVRKPKGTKFSLLNCFLNIFIPWLLVVIIDVTAKDDFQNYSGILNRTSIVACERAHCWLWQVGPWPSLTATGLRNPEPLLTHALKWRHLTKKKDLFVSFHVRTTDIVDFLLHLSNRIKLEACALCKHALRSHFLLTS